MKRENDDDDDEVAGDDEVDVHWGGTTHVSVGLPTLSFDFLSASHLSAMLHTAAFVITLSVFIFVSVFEFVLICICSIGIPTSSSLLSVPHYKVCILRQNSINHCTLMQMKITFPWINFADRICVTKNVVKI